MSLLCKAVPFLLLNCLDCLGDLVSHIFYIMCTVIYFLSLGSLVFATDAELYKNMTNIVNNYDTLL